MINELIEAHKELAETLDAKWELLVESENFLRASKLHIPFSMPISGDNLADATMSWEPCEKNSKNWRIHLEVEVQAQKPLKLPFVAQKLATRLQYAPFINKFVRELSSFVTSLASDHQYSNKTQS